jgi:hypothetical protein
MRTALFWVNTQRLVVIPYRRFGTTYRSRLQSSRIHEMLCLGLSMKLLNTWFVGMYGLIY